MLVITNMMGNASALRVMNAICCCAHKGLKNGFSLQLPPTLPIILFSQIKITAIILPRFRLIPFWWWISSLFFCPNRVHFLVGLDFVLWLPLLRWMVFSTNTGTECTYSRSLLVHIPVSARAEHTFINLLFTSELLYSEVYRQYSNNTVGVIVFASAWLPYIIWSFSLTLYCMVLGLFLPYQIFKLDLLVT